MEKHFGNAAPGESPGKKHIIDPEPAIPGETPGIPVPGDPLEIDRGIDEVEPIGDGDDGLGDSIKTRIQQLLRLQNMMV